MGLDRLARAAENGKLEIVHKLWEWAKEVLTQEEVNNMLLGKDTEKMTACTWQQGRAIKNYYTTIGLD